MSQYPGDKPDRLDLPGERKAPVRKEKPPYQVDSKFENYYDPRLAQGAPAAQAPKDPDPYQDDYDYEGYRQSRAERVRERRLEEAENQEAEEAYRQAAYYQQAYQQGYRQGMEQGWQTGYRQGNGQPYGQPYPQGYPQQPYSPAYQQPYAQPYPPAACQAPQEEPVYEEEEEPKRKRNGFGKFLLTVELLLSAAVAGLLLYLNVLPAKFLLIGGGALLLYWLIMLGLQKPRATRGFGKFMMILMIAALALSTGYLWRTNAALSNMFEGGIFGGGKNAAKEPFTVYISGNDGYGDTEAEGRSDVNILLTVNPETHQIVMTTTPRDYYIELPEDEFGGARDKLTHAGLYGIDVSEQVLSELYGVKIDYYVRVNFSGFESIVDALGGVSVWSDYDFTAVSGETYYQGYNDVDGVEALAFVRERYAFSDGDFQRGRNQMYMIRAIIAKITSPSILMNYSGLLASVESCVLTDMPRSMITALVRLQLDESPEWNIVSNTVSGYGDMQPTYSGGSQSLSVVWPDEESVEAAAELIQRCLRGEILEGN